MKSKNIIQIVMVAFFMLTLSSFKNIQNAKTITAVFDGAEDYGYNFIFTNDDEDERTITFQNINNDVLKTFDLNSDALIGTKMKVTYTTEILVEEDEDGFEIETEASTITKLEKVK
ncbi:MAG: hypothetical protein ACPG41_07060 [Lacinutrix venerupis]